MLKEIPMYTVVCDGCGKDSNEDAEYSAWGCKSYASDVAMEADFVKEGEEEHYCPDCYCYDDDDNLVIKNKSEDK